ncbi:MAG: ribonuclease P protein component [bacterium]|jgi:ribonuclease P protein component|nr:ribonuclease P protein component [Betaproteobacteria bacterium]
MLARPHRLLGEHEFRSVLASRNRWSTPDCSIHVRCNPGAPIGMLGFIVGRKALRRAVDRNRFKRCIRGRFRELLALLPGLQVVVRLRGKPRAGADHAASEVCTRLEDVAAWYASQSDCSASTATS